MDRPLKKLHVNQLVKYQTSMNSLTSNNIIAMVQEKFENLSDEETQVICRAKVSNLPVIFLRYR